MRIVRIVVFLVALAAIVAPSASALDFTDDSSPLPGGIEGTPYSFQLKGSEGCPPYNYRVILGTLPGGITLSSSGLLSGTPTASGTASFWVELGDICGSFPSQGLFSIDVKPKVTVTTTSLPAAASGVPYSVTLTAKGWNPPLTWTLVGGTLPPGLNLSADGTISGTTTTVGSFTVTIKASVLDGRSDTKQFTLNVLAPLAATPPATVPPAEVGRLFKVTPGATGGLMPYTWSIAAGSALPPDLTINPATGVISGFPIAAGSFPVKVAVVDATGAQATIDLTINVVAKVAITTSRLKAGRVGRLYAARVAARGGVAPLRWALLGGTLPRGVRLDRATGLLTGTPRTAGLYRFTIAATDSLGVSSTKKFVLVVSP